MLWFRFWKRIDEFSIVYCSFTLVFSRFFFSLDDVWQSMIWISVWKEKVSNESYKFTEILMIISVIEYNQVSHLSSYLLNNGVFDSGDDNSSSAQKIELPGSQWGTFDNSASASLFTSKGRHCWSTSLSGFSCFYEMGGKDNCCVIGCNSNRHLDDNISFFSFPLRNKRRKKRWENAVRKGMLAPFLHGKKIGWPRFCWLCTFDQTRLRQWTRQAEEKDKY